MLFKLRFYFWWYLNIHKLRFRSVQPVDFCEDKASINIYQIHQAHLIPAGSGRMCQTVSLRAAVSLSHLTSFHQFNKHTVQFRLAGSNSIIWTTTSSADIFLVHLCSQQVVCKLVHSPASGVLGKQYSCFLLKWFQGLWGSLMRTFLYWSCKKSLWVLHIMKKKNLYKGTKRM